MTETSALDDAALTPAEREEEEHLAGILRRVQLGDTSVTDEVFWLQNQENIVTGKKREP